jgi:SAM-dependent methyltransferase
VLPGNVVMLMQKARGAIQRSGPQFMKRRWEHLRDTAGDPVYKVLGRFARNKTMLDLGCGTGSTITELPEHFCGAYCALDISEVAIDEARSRASDRPEAVFVQGDMLTYEPARLFDVILLRESIYYNSIAGALHALERYARYLAPGGVFVVRMCRAVLTNQPIRDLIAKHFEVLEETEYQEPLAVISVFRPH